MRDTLVVNLIAGPSAGKSTLAAYIFSMLKFDGFLCELVTEHAKDLVWDESKIISNQIYLFGEQHRRIERLKGKVDVIVADGSLLLSLIYGDKIGKEFCDLVKLELSKSDNLNLFVKREKNYQEIGRIHNFDEAKAIDKDILFCLKSNEYPFVEVNGNKEGGDLAVNLIKNILCF